MGLDMYLYQDDKYNNELIYWRKANAIHGWFDKKIEGGVRNGDLHKVSKEDISKLIKCLEEDIEYLHTLRLDRNMSDFLNLDKSKLNLTPTEGFFFGNYRIDRGYLDDLERSLNNLLSLDESIETFYYCGDW